MKKLHTKPNNFRGSSLVEIAIAMGVLAIAVPLVFGILAESGKTTTFSEAESHSAWIIPTCVQEIQASRSGNPQFFPTTLIHETFPPKGEVWALAFSKQGEPIGKVTYLEYTKGTSQIDNKPIRYLAKLSAVNASLTGATHNQLSELRIQITLEFPATSPVAKRQKLEFYTQFP
jgi:hypothetical protein